ncbi:hypothetical protein O9G_002989 [Rozella allomycis CSF55]|uniref:Uncharacterized protein n=1 Tax=Rozella allomycis (strain CSF55) TaxID=988480 RepID=A0A075B0F0_ROZAC|nr:hypothetical protein O9G_002989 [Rozella allomycis CSF55]|eukprot:EPZ34269.1 hypothetical protein O9G_002989 [Rozella allomycis CSF55]
MATEVKGLLEDDRPEKVIDSLYKFTEKQGLDALSQQMDKLFQEVLETFFEYLKTAPLILPKYKSKLEQISKWHRKEFWIPGYFNAGDNKQRIKDEFKKTVSKPELGSEDIIYYVLLPQVYQDKDCMDAFFYSPSSLSARKLMITLGLLEFPYMFKELNERYPEHINFPLAPKFDESADLYDFQGNFITLLHYVLRLGDLDLLELFAEVIDETFDDAESEYESLVTLLNVLKSNDESLGWFLRNHKVDHCPEETWFLTRSENPEIHLADVTLAYICKSKHFKTLSAQSRFPPNYFEKLKILDKIQGNIYGKLQAVYDNDDSVVIGAHEFKNLFERHPTSFLATYYSSLYMIANLKKDTSFSSTNEFRLIFGRLLKSFENNQSRIVKKFPSETKNLVEQLAQCLPSEALTELSFFLPDNLVFSTGYYSKLLNENSEFNKERIWLLLVNKGFIDFNDKKKIIRQMQEQKYFPWEDNNQFIYDLMKDVHPMATPQNLKFLVEEAVQGEGVKTAYKIPSFKLSKVQVKKVKKVEEQPESIN